MDLPSEAITEFKQIYQEEFGEELSEEEAYDKAMRVLQLFSIIYLEKRDGFNIGKDPPFDNRSIRGNIDK